jgi:hypothetical protein
MNAKVVEALQEHWWSVPQALVWIVSRSEALVERALSLTTIASLKQLGLRPFSTGEGLPVTLNAAPNELIRAAIAEKISIYGEKYSGPPGIELVPVRELFWPELFDINGLNGCWPCIIEKRQLQPDRRAWTALLVRADDTRGFWPLKSESKDETDSGVSETIIDAWLRGEMATRRRVGELKDRDTMVVAVMTEFPGQLSKTRAKALFTAVPEDLKDKPGPKRGSRQIRITGPKDPARCQN